MNTIVGALCNACGEANEYEIDGREVRCVECGHLTDRIVETRSERQTRRLKEYADRQMTVGELRDRLEEYEDDTNVGVLACGAWNYADTLSVTEADGHPVLIIEEGSR